MTQKRNMMKKVLLLAFLGLASLIILGCQEESSDGYVEPANNGPDETTQWATITVDGNKDDWEFFTPEITDPEGDTACGSNADIKHIYTAIDENFAYLMVETYGTPIHSEANIEINFDYISGVNIENEGPYDDLTTGFGSSELSASNANGQRYTINDYEIRRGNVMEAKISLSDLENTTYFNPTFINIWDSSYSISTSGCEATRISGTPNGPGGTVAVDQNDLVGIWRRLDTGNDTKGKEYHSDGTGFLGNFSSDTFAQSTSFTWSLNGDILTEGRESATTYSEKVTEMSGSKMKQYRQEDSNTRNWEKQ